MLWKTYHFLPEHLDLYKKIFFNNPDTDSKRPDKSTLRRDFNSYFVLFKKFHFDSDPDPDLDPELPSKLDPGKIFSDPRHTAFL